MPWHEVKPMDQKLLFVADCVADRDSMTVLCARYGISRKTGYKWLARYQALGMDGLQERSRRPWGHPRQTPYTLRQAIIELRQSGRGLRGPKKIRELLAVRYPDADLPGLTTIYHVLKRAGLITSTRRRRRVAPTARPFASVQACNQLWSADYKGQFKTGDGAWCYPLTIMDHHSRRLLCCQGLRGPRLAQTQQAFTRLFRRYGLPERLRTDNGAPFASTAPGGLSRLAVWWIRLGITPERITPGKPQQNARHERMHRTLKADTARPPAASLVAQQRRFDDFLDEYNHQRPHEALGQWPPARLYRPSQRAFPERLPAIDYPGHVQVRTVKPPGIVYWGGGQVYVGQVLIGQPVALEEIDNDLWQLHFAHVPLGRIHYQQPQGNGLTTPYWSVSL